ncbi:MAG: MFS transporter [Planctomycetaceae bacterium]|nr:MFS transporter [Planctomycetaceae bacterium]
MDRKWWVLLSVGTGTFMSALDSSIVNTVLPVIQRNFGCDVAQVQWAVTVYLLTISVLLLSFGRLGDLRGHKLVYTSGFGLFVIGSALCGAAPSVGGLVLFRGVQALGAAMVFATGPALLTMNFPARQRGQAMGMQATMTYLGLASGPAIGGWLAHAFGWRAAFYVNVPVGAVALACGACFIPSRRRAELTEPFDYLGAVSFTAGLIALLLALNQGHEWGWRSTPIVSLTAISVLLLALFLHVERRSRHPMLDLSLFRNRVFSASVTAAVFNYICTATIAFLLPFYLVRGRGMDTATAGILLSVQPLVMAVAAPISGTISDRVRSGVPSAIGMGILAGGALLLSFIGPKTPCSYVVAACSLTGLGTGVFISPNNSALMGAAPRNRQGIAAGVMATARNVGMVLGVGLSGAVLTTMLALDPACKLANAVGPALAVATVAAVFGGLASLVRSSRNGEAADPASNPARHLENQPRSPDA